MKVLFDHQIFGRQVYGGISRYFYELLQQFWAANILELEISIKYAKCVYLQTIKGCCPWLRSTHGWDTYFSKIKKINARLTQKRLKAGDYDVFHPTYYDPYFRDTLGDKPFVITVHDLTHEVFQDDYVIENRVIEQKQQLIHAAAHIIAVSQNTKKDLQRFYHIPSDKISVIYEACSLDQVTATPPIEAIPETYLLFVGARRKYKNFNTFLSSMPPLLRQLPSLHIVCVGGRPFTEEEQNLFASHQIADQVRWLSPSDGQMVWLYQHAQALVYPSLYEGFGLPILEAFSCDCPTIVSNVSSLPEVAGDAALYIDPTSTSSIQEQVSRLLENPSLRQEAIHAGRKQLQQFTWAKTARETEAVYRSVNQS